MRRHSLRTAGETETCISECGQAGQHNTQHNHGKDWEGLGMIDRSLNPESRSRRESYQICDVDWMPSRSELRNKQHRSTHRSASQTNDQDQISTCTSTVDHVRCISEEGREHVLKCEPRPIHFLNVLKVMDVWNVVCRWACFSHEYRIDALWPKRDRSRRVLAAQVVVGPPLHQRSERIANAAPV